MSFAGMLAGGLAGGARALGDQAAGDIEQQRRSELAREDAAIREQMTMRLAEYQSGVNRRSAQNAASDARDFANAPETRASTRQGMLDTAATAQEIELGKLNNKPLTDAQRVTADILASDDTRRKGEALKALTPGEAERAGAMADASGKATAKYREPKANSSAELAQKFKAMEKVLGRELNEQEKLAILGILKNSPRDPELDTETEVIEKMNPDGTTSKTTRKKVRRPENVEKPTRASVEDAHTDAKAAITTGRMSLGEANKRLVAAGYEPLPSAGAQSTEAKPPQAKLPAKAQTTAAHQPIGAKPTDELKRYTRTHPDYALVQAELERRKSAQYSSEPAGPRWRN